MTHKLSDLAQYAALAALVFLTACTPKPPVARAVASPELAVKAFYDWRIDSQMTGAPTPAQLASMRPYVSAELQGLLAEARAIHDRDAASAKDAKPAFAEGDLFSSLFEGPTSFTTGEVESDGAAHIVPVRFVSARELPAVNWIDRVRVVQENGAYVVADVEYGNHWNSGAKGTLVEWLKKATTASGKRRA